MNGIMECVLFDKQRFCHNYYMWDNLSSVVQNASAFTDFACSVKKQLGQTDKQRISHNYCMWRKPLFVCRNVLRHL